MVFPENTSVIQSGSGARSVAGVLRCTWSANNRKRDDRQHGTGDEVMRCLLELNMVECCSRVEKALRIDFLEEGGLPAALVNVTTSS